MSHHPPSVLALQLATFATRTGGPLPLLDGLSASLAQSGVAFLARELRTAPDGRWFRQTPTFWTLSEALTDLAAQREFVLVVQWRRLLAKALLRHPSTDMVSPALRRLAHHAWWTLLPMLRDHDVVMHQLLTTAQRNFQGSSRAEFEPLWVGFDTEDDERRFDAQATALLASRRTDEKPHDGFCEIASRWFRDVLAAATHPVVQRNVGLCSSGNHSRGHVCPNCPEIAKERPFLLALIVPALFDRQIRRTIDLTVPEPTQRASSVLRDNLEWLLASRYRRDGVCSFVHSNGAQARFIDFHRLWERWRELQMPTMFDSIPAMHTIDGPRQARAYLTRLLDGAVIPPRSYSAEELFVGAGWGSTEDFATSYSQFEAVYDAVLLQLLTRVDQRAGALLKARLVQPAPPTAPPKRRIVVRHWQPLNGDHSVPIRVLRTTSQNKQRANFYTLPYDVDDPMVKDRQARIGKGIKYDGELYWTAHAINHFANKFDADNEPTYPWAREFCEWVNLQEPALADDKLFNAAIYSERLPLRLKAITDGKLAHLGAFSLQEDEILKSFFFAPTIKKRLIAADWVPLLEKLPGRTERGILKRLEELGKKYAFQHGYQAYLRSPWCRKFSAQRRKQWIKEGCPQ